MKIDITITIDEPENPALAASKELAGAYLDGLTGWAKAKHDEKNSPEAEAADRKEPYFPVRPGDRFTIEQPLKVLPIFNPQSPKQVDPSTEAAQARKIARLEKKIASQANELTVQQAALAHRGDLIHKYMDRNLELTKRVDELVAELAESELRASKFEKHNLQLQSANTALRTTTLMTGVKIPAIGETVDVITLDMIAALPIGARFRDGDGDVLQKGDEHGVHWVGDIGKYFTDLSSFGPFTRIEDAEATDE